MPASTGSSKDRAKDKVKLLKIVADFAQKQGRSPSRADMLQLGYSRDSIRNLFNSLVKLKSEARKAYPESFINVIDETIFNKASLNTLKLDVSNYRRFIVTTAVVGCKVHSGFLASIKKYCVDNSAKLLVLSGADPAATCGWTLDSKVGKENVVSGDLALNNNVFISTIQLSAKYIDPITGLDRLGHRGSSFIYGSPKQRMRLVPMGNTKFPHAIMTTGAITKPKYHTDRYMSLRTAYVATKDHVMGAIILELDEKNRFHFRQVQSDQAGGFIDLGHYYLRDSVTRIYADALAMGDWHSGETDPLAKRSWKELASIVQPKDIFVHDGFNGRSINPHERDQTINQALKAQKGFLNLADELRQFAIDLDEIQSWSKNGAIVVKSNHDVFLERWLQEGRYINDPHNYAMGVLLAGAMLQGKDPLQCGVEMMGLQNKSRVKWLSIDDDYKVAGVQMAAHGHKGANGSRNPGLASLEKCYGESMTGHSHSSEILRGAWRVGTSSYLKLDYNKGPSSWVHCSGLVYPNGSRQLIHSIEGRWHLPKGSK